MLRSAAFCLSLAVAFAARAAAPSFLAPPALAVDASPRSIAVADFDEDGRADMAVAGADTDSVFILIEGQPASAFETGTTTGSVATADFNADAHADLAVTTQFGISILHGGGDGTFSAPLDVSVPSVAYLVRAADFNGDALPDLAVASADSGTELRMVSILIGDGAGGFSAGATLDGGDFDIGDVDGDANADLVAAVAHPTGLLVHVGNGDGTFTEGLRTDAGVPPNVGYLSPVVLSDVDGDADLDLIAPRTEGEVLSLMRGDGAGDFGAAETIDAGTAPKHLIASDFDLDGDADLVIASRDHQHVSILAGDGAGGFGPPAHYGGLLGPLFVAAADLDGDAKPDLAVANELSNTVAVLHGDGSGGVTDAVRQPTVTRFARAVAAGDLDADTHLDLVVASESDGFFSVLLGDGSGNFTRSDVTVGGLLNAVAVADLNQDGLQDVVLAVRQPSGLDFAGFAILFGDGTGAFAAPVRVTTPNPVGLAVADLNVDGRPDLLTTTTVNNVRGVLVVLNAGGGAFLAPEHFPTGPNQPAHLVTAHFDNDGFLDLAVANTAATPSISILMGTGTGRFSAPMVFPLGSGLPAVHIAAGDLDHDGNVDLVTASGNAGAVSVLWSGGSASFLEPPSTYPAGRGAAVAIADFDGDGHPDLAVTHGSEGTLSVLSGDGARNFSEPAIFPAGADVLHMAIGDFLEDGRADIAATNPGAHTVTLLLNDSAGGNTPAGTDVTVLPIDTTTGSTPVTMTFAQVIQSGTTTLTTNDTGPAPPSGFVLGDPPVYFDLQTTASYSGTINVCIDYSDLGFEDDSELTLWHYEGGQWIDVTGTHDVGNDILCGQVTSLSPFAIFAPQPDSCPATATLDAVKVRIGVADRDYAAIRLDLRAEVHRNGTLVGAAEVAGAAPGGFNNDRLITIPLPASALATCPGDTIEFTLRVRNACEGSAAGSGTARLLYNAASVNSHFRTTGDKYFLLDGFVLGTTHGSGPPRTIDVPAGPPCAPFQSFGTWRLEL